jgi:hypothetical protein
MICKDLKSMFGITDTKIVNQTDFHVELFFLHLSTARHQVRVDEMGTNCECST